MAIIFATHNPLVVKLLTILRLSFSHLKGHKFKYIVQDSVV